MKTPSFRLLLVSAFAVSACSSPSPIAGPEGSTHSGSLLKESTLSQTPALTEASVRYENKEVGFSILLPTKMALVIEKCGGPPSVPPPASYFDSYYEETPVIAIEDGTQTFLTPAYHYDSDCHKKPSDKAYLAERRKENPGGRMAWLLESKTIANDAELEAFIQDRYGKDCGLGEKAETAQKGTFDIYISGLTSPEDGDCFVNYATEMKYSPSLKKLVYWDLGQDYTFRTATDASYDNDVAASFRFE